jgi:serine/threonine protein kinase
MSRGHVQFILYQLLCALNYVHSAGIIHGNVRPENVLINPDTSVRLCDFSNARAFGGPSPPRSPRGSLDAVLYEAPEILLGAAKVLCELNLASVADPCSRVDIFW